MATGRPARRFGGRPKLRGLTSGCERGYAISNNVRPKPVLITRIDAQAIFYAMRYATVLSLLLTFGLLDSTPSYAQSADSLARPDSPPPFLVPAPSIPDSLLDAEWASYQDALEAAHVDPGILHYVVPPPGTKMPQLGSSDSADPAMIYPKDDSTAHPDTP